MTTLNPNMLLAIPGFVIAIFISFACVWKSRTTEYFSRVYSGTTTLKRGSGIGAI